MICTPHMHMFRSTLCLTNNFHFSTLFTYHSPHPNPNFHKWNGKQNDKRCKTLVGFWWDDFRMVPIIISLNLLFGPEIMMIQKNPEGWMVGVWDGDRWDLSHPFWALSHHYPTRRCTIKLPKKKYRKIHWCHVLHRCDPDHSIKFQNQAIAGFWENCIFSFFHIW